MILAYHLGTSARAATFDRNQRFLNRVTNGQIVGVVSTFTVAECIAVLAAAYAERDGAAPTAKQLGEARNRIEGFVRAAGIEMQDADVLCQSPEGRANAFARVMQIALSTRPSRGRDGRWRNVGGADALHIAFAERSDSDALATFDEGFRNMRSPVSLMLVQEA